MNRNKRSVALDITGSAGREAVLALAEQCDVVVENFIPGKLASLGIGYEHMRARNPALIYVSISGAELFPASHSGCALSDTWAFAVQGLGTRGRAPNSLATTSPSPRSAVSCPSRGPTAARRQSPGSPLLTSSLDCTPLRPSTLLSSIAR